MHHARLALLATLLAPTLASAAANIVIQSRDPAGVGFNDTTPAAPVGGNNGTTLGQQRMNAYKYVANLWATRLNSTQPIIVNAGWEALECDASSAVLGSAGAWNIWHDFVNGKPGTWYPQALANKLAGTNLSAGQPDDGSGFGNVDIVAQFNVNLGKTGCLEGSPFYLGLDGNAGAKINFVEVLLHEMAHGLGFSPLTVDYSDGSRYLGIPSVWEGFLYDNAKRKSWLTMTNAERAASAISPLKVVWTGGNVVAGVPQTLNHAPTLSVNIPTGNSNTQYPFGAASFGPPVGNPSVSGPIGVLAGNGCSPLSITDKARVRGKVAVIDRGTCTFTMKVKTAQNAGAIAVLIADNDPTNSPDAPPAMSGTDPTINIPSVRVSQQTGVKIKQAVADAAKRTPPLPVIATLAIDPQRYAGADATNHPFVYSPSILEGGSSISHWDTTATPNLLMEPNINSDLTTTTSPPKDLTLPLLKDIGW